MNADPAGEREIACWRTYDDLGNAIDSIGGTATTVEAGLVVQAAIRANNHPR